MSPASRFVLTLYGLALAFGLGAKVAGQDWGGMVCLGAAAAAMLLGIGAALGAADLRWLYRHGRLDPDLKPKDKR